MDNLEIIIGRRLREVRDFMKKSQKDFSEILSLPTATYAKYESGIRSLPDEIKLRICQLGINPSWLLTGKGDMITEEDSASTYRVPLLRQIVSCGPGQDWSHDDNIEEFIEIGRMFPVPIRNIYAFRVAGESMIGAGIRHGDILFFDGSRHQELGAGGIFIFGWMGEVYCKLLKFERISNTIQIYSFIKADIQEAEFVRSISGDDENFVIFGRVLGWMHENTIMPLYKNAGKLLQ